MKEKQANLLCSVRTVEVSTGVELSALVNEGEDTAGWEVTAGLGVAGVVRQVTCEAVLQEVLGQS